MPIESNDGYYEVFWPRTPRQTRVKPLARRLDSLEGKTVAQLWDFLFRGDQVFASLEGELKARYPGIRFINWREFGNIHVGKEKEVLSGLAQRMRELGVDAVITGLGA